MFCLRAVWWWNGPFDPHNASRWHSQVPLCHIAKKMQETVRLSAPSFSFDSLSQHPLSNYRGYWDRLSNCLDTLSRFSQNNGKAAIYFTKSSYLVGKWCFCYCPSILIQWSPYTAKYPWPPILPEPPKKIMRLEPLHMEYNMAQSGERIRRLRIKSGLTQESAATALNIDRSFYNRIEAGKKAVPLIYLYSFRTYSMLRLTT